MGVVIAVFAIIAVLVLITSSSRAGGGYDGLVARGLPGRGILLSVGAQPLSTSGTATRRFQQRYVRIDIELLGQPPYELDATPYIPMNLVPDILPGATVEVRVDRKDRTKIAIVGPGVGFAGAALLGAAPAAPASDPGQSGRAA